jgi:hypothetical protein
VLWLATTGWGPNVRAELICNHAVSTGRLDMSTLPPISGAYDVRTFARSFGICRTRVFEEIAAGRLKARRAGGKLLIPMSEGQRWLDSLPAAREGAAA